MAPSSRASRTCTSSSASPSSRALSGGADVPAAGERQEPPAMFAQFFFALREARVPVSLREYLTLIEAVKAGLANYAIEDFYYLSRAALVKDERHLDKFDRVFGACFKGIETPPGETVEIPEEWLRKLVERLLTEEEKAQIAALGGLDKLMELLRQRLDDQVELGTRNIKVALRRLRRFAREGAAEELDLPDTIASTARNAGYLDLKFVPERHNTVKVLLLLDVGGSMFPHVRACEELFSAARSEFKHLEFFYFHNCVYEGVWKDNTRRRVERMATLDLMHTFPGDYKLIFVGDASMSPYEITAPGGSVEHWNEEPGQLWLQRLLHTYERAVWLNPVPEHHWPYTVSIEMIDRLMGGRMFPLTLDGLDRAIRALSR